MESRTSITGNGNVGALSRIPANHLHALLREPRGVVAVLEWLDVEIQSRLAGLVKATNKDDLWTAMNQISGIDYVRTMLNVVLDKIKQERSIL